MADVKLYTSSYCPFCTQAKMLLNSIGVEFEEIDASGDDALRQELVKRSGQQTVPQIFVGEVSVGGYSELKESVDSGRFQELLKGQELPEGQG